MKCLPKTLIMKLERIILKVDEMQAAVEAILFASGEPIEYERIAEALEIEPEYAENLLMNLGASLDERGSGICLVRMDNQFQLCTRSQYADKIRAVLEIKKNSPLSKSTEQAPVAEISRACAILSRLTDAPFANKIASIAAE